MADLDEIMKVDMAFNGDLVKKSDGDLEGITGLSNFKQALFQRLITTPGTLVHRPTYGVGLKDFQNAPNTLANQRKIAARIKEQFELDPRVEEVLGVRVEVDDLTPWKLLIIVRVKPVGYDEVTAEFIPFGGEGIS